MTKMDHQRDLTVAEQNQSDISLLDMLLVAAKYKKLILLLPLAAAIVAAVISFIIPPVYKATTTVLPPQQSQSSAAALMAQLGGAGGALGSLAGLKSPNDLYVSMLKSRSVADPLLKRFDLQKRYETEYRDEALQELEKNTEIKAGKEGLISITVADHDRKHAAAIANAYVEELTRLTGVVATTEAAQRRVFYERQLEGAKNKLASAEIAFKRAAESGGMVSVDGQSRAVVEMIGRVRAQITSKEIQLSSLKAFVTPNNHEYRKVHEELQSLRQELQRLEGGSGRSDTDNVDSSKNGFESIKILRDVKYYQMLYDLLAKQYEIARLDEAKEGTVIQVLDKAVEPERRSKPQRSLMVILAFVVALGFSVVLAFVLDSLSRLRGNTETNGKFQSLREQLSFKPAK